MATRTQNVDCWVRTSHSCEALLLPAITIGQKHLKLSISYTQDSKCFFLLYVLTWSVSNNLYKMHLKVLMACIYLHNFRQYLVLTRECRCWSQSNQIRFYSFKQCAPTTHTTTTRSTTVVVSIVVANRTVTCRVPTALVWHQSTL